MKITKGAILLPADTQLHEQVQQVLPEVKSGAVGGHLVLAVKHGLEQTYALRNLGIDVPSPINYGWRYPGMYKPRDNQYHTAAFATLYQRAFILNEMRTGKTSAALWGAEYLMQEGYVRRVLIACPKSCMRDVWENALFETLPHRSCAIMHGTKDARIKQMNRGTPFCIINHDGIPALGQEVKKGKRTVMTCEALEDQFDLVIFDEGDVLCNHRTRLYRTLTAILQPTTWLWLLTGTPTPNQYADAWGLLRLICPTLPVKSWTQFRELVMYRASQWTWENRPGAKEVLYSLMQPSIRFTQAECFDLPAVQELWRSAEMSKDQKRMYWQMQKEGKLERPEGQPSVAAANAAVKVAKMLQISSGAVKDENGDKISIDCAPRFSAMLEILHESGVRPCKVSGAADSKKIVVFMPYKYVMQDVFNALQAKGYRCCLVNGDVPEWKRAELFAGFRGTHATTSLYEILIAHPETTAHGQDFTVAETILWYGPCFGNRFYAQGNMRIQGEKQKGNPAIYHLTCTALERQRFEALRKGGQSQADFLAMYERALEEEV